MQAENNLSTQNTVTGTLKYGSWFALLIFFVNLILKLWFLSYNDLALDEPFTLFHSQKSFAGIFEMLRGENNPPLYFLFMKIWTSTFGIGTFAARFPSVVFSSLAAAMIYLTGRKFFNLRTGLIASLLFSFSNTHLFYAQDARVYALFFLLAVCSNYIFFCLQQTPGSKKLLISWIILNVLLLYSHFFGIVFVFFQLIAVLSLKQLRESLLKQTLWCCFALILLFSPYISILIQRFISTTGNTPWIQPPLWSDLYTMFWRFSNTPVNTVIMLALLFIGIYLSFSRKKINNVVLTDKFRILLFLLFIPFLFIFFVSFKIPLFLDRYLIFVSLYYYLLVAISIDFLFPKKSWSTGIAMLLPLLMAFSYHFKSEKNRNVKELVEKVRTGTGENTAIYIYPEWFDLNFVYYYEKDWFTKPDETRSLLNDHHIYPILHPEDLDSNSLSSFKDVFLIDAEGGTYDEGNPFAVKIETIFPKKEISEIYEHLYIIHFSKAE